MADLKVPIPIHLPRPPGLDGLSFRLPRPLPMEKPAKPMKPLWNPARDLCTTPKPTTAKDVPDSPRKTPVSSVPRPVSPSISSSSLSSSSTILTSASTPSAPAPATALMMSKTSPPSPIAAMKAPPMMGPSIYEQLQRHFPVNMDNPLAVLASKGVLFPNLLGAHTHPGPHPTQTHPHPPLSLPERHMSLQNALVLAQQSRAVMERLASASQPHLQRPPLGHPPPPPHPHHQNCQQQQHHHHHPPQQPNTALAPQQPAPAPSHIHHPIPLPEAPAVSLQNALALAQSRALMERVNASQILSPVISMDNPVNHGYGRKLFPCPQCRYTTDRRNNLKRHMLTMHQTSSKMLECCGILFNTKASLREHAMIFHYHGYTCYFCGRRFCRKALLKRHLSVHNGQKDFVCNVCDYATSHKSNLERHRKVHSRQDDGKDGEGEDGQHYSDADNVHRYHDDMKSNGSEAVSHDDVSSDELSVCSDYDDDIDVEIDVHSD